MIHVWYIYLHLVDFYGKCRYIHHIPYLDAMSYTGCLIGILTMVHYTVILYNLVVFHPLYSLNFQGCHVILLVFM